MPVYINRLSNPGEIRRVELLPDKVIVTLWDKKVLIYLKKSEVTK